MKSFKKFVAEDKSLERALATDAQKPKKKPTLPKAPWDKKDEAMSPETKAKEAKRAGVGRSGETFRDRQKRLGKPQTEAKDEYCSDKCCGSDVKAEDCKCAPDCPHCNCNAEDVNETFNPNHPKVKAARKAHKAGTWDGNVDKNGNAIVHINGKPHTVTKGDPAARNEDLDDDTINQLTAEYINENNISMAELEAMSQEQLDEIIGKAIGGAFKLGAKAAVGTARLAGKGAVGAGRLAKKAVVNKQGNVRTSAAGRADSIEKKAAAQEKKNRDRERIKAAQKRLRKAKQDSRKKPGEAKK